MGHFLKSASAVAIALSLVACSSLPSSSTGDARNAGRDATPDAPQYWAALEAKIGDVEVGWISSLNDPVLVGLVKEAQENNKNIQAAAANVDRSWALAKQAGAALSPNVNLTSGAQRSGSVDGGSSPAFNVGLQASWEVDLWGRIRSGRAAAVNSAEAAEADYRYAQQSLAAGVARAYFIAIEAERQEQIAKSTVETIEETNRIVGIQYENGVATEQDVSLAKSDLASAKSQLSATTGGKRDALRALELLLGRYPGADILVGQSLPAQPEQPPAGLASELLERRPDLIAAERRIAASINNVDQARAARLPALSLTGNLGGASNDLSNLLSPGNIAWTAASSLLVPVIDGGARDAQVDVNTADQRAAVSAYADAALSAFSEVETALDQGVILRERLEALQEAEKEAQNAYRLAELRFKEGESDLLDVLAIQQRVFAAQSSLETIRRSQLDQYVDLQLALGGDWRSDSP